MAWAAWEQRRLLEIDRQLDADEPALHRALTRLSARPLLVRRAQAVVRAVAPGARARVALAVAVLGAGLALLLVGGTEDLLVVAVLGIVIVQVPPLLLIGRTPGRPARRQERPAPTGRR